MSLRSLPRPVVVLGLAGILPQAACVVSGVVDPAARWAANAAGCFYAAIILSFLGGIWWADALRAGDRRWWHYLLAVTPSLVAWGALLPWFQGLAWPGPSLVVLGVCLLLSPVADRALTRIAAPPAAGWLQLRLILSFSLGLCTLALALLPPPALAG
ncbi:DUF3429 domain-containing protein [Sphingomonas sp. NBWT7]|uniref:DUF3429 domain-containing protein n=1 Tax=Sphingomonas sp. NBWT7 TaxID=2596913 RepID=UPI0016239868|nr:DUF3429 domain-containing protein [Sphingomonas sp. NBWT7]QNE30788.1 DUF3429 domain-containing protein [Sphingomonas sp. NBWT7]